MEFKFKSLLPPQKEDELVAKEFGLRNRRVTVRSDLNHNDGRSESKNGRTKEEVFHTRASDRLRATGDPKFMRNIPE